MAGQVEANTWGFLDKQTGDTTLYLSFGGGRGAPGFHSGVCFGVHRTEEAVRAVLSLLHAATGTDADIDAAINGLPGYATGPFPGVTGAAWWLTVPADVKPSVRAWLRAKALAVVH